MQGVEIKTVTEQEIAQVAGIHYRALPDDFLPSLGLDFLERVYYPAAMKSSSAVTIVARCDSQVAGFITIAQDSPQFTRDILSGRWLQIGWYALRSLFSHPLVFQRSFAVLWSALFSRPDPLRAEIVFIAVAPEFRHRGIGRQLVTSAVEHAGRHGESNCRTKTLSSNVGVIKMYEQMGWHIRDVFRLIGREYVTLVSG